LDAKAQRREDRVDTGRGSGLASHTRTLPGRLLSLFEKIALAEIFGRVAVGRAGSPARRRS